MWNSAMTGREPRPTTMPCRKCDQNVEVRRTCFQVYLHCPGCGAKYPVEEYVHCMDEALEEYMEGVFCNRI